MSKGQSDAKRAYWASLTPEEKARRGRNFDLRVMGKIKQWLASEGLIEEVPTSD